MRFSLSDKSASKRTKKDRNAHLASNPSWRKKKKDARRPCSFSVTRILPTSLGLSRGSNSKPRKLYKTKS